MFRFPYNTDQWICPPFRIPESTSTFYKAEFFPHYLLATMTSHAAFVWVPPGVLLEAVTRALDVAVLGVATATKKRPTTSRYLLGPWAPQRSERVQQYAKVTGSLPADLRGMFVTVCPNPIHLPEGGYHIFDGDGALACVRVHNSGRASFAFRHLLTTKLKTELRIGRSRSLSFASFSDNSGSLLPLIVLAKLRDLIQSDEYSASPANTNIEQFGDQVMALWEGDLPYRLRVSDDGASLSCNKLLDLKGKYRGEFSAHPVVHPTSGNVFAVSYTVGRPQNAVVVVLDKRLRFLRKVSLSFGRTPMIHDAAITSKYIVLFDFPLLFTPLELLRGGEPLSLQTSERSRIGLMPVDSTDGNDVVWFSSDPTMAFHAACAWDTPSGAEVYVCEHSVFSISDPLKFNDGNRLVRHSLDVSKGTCIVEEEPVDLSEFVEDNRYGFDFPFVNKTVSGGPVQFVYMTVFLPDNDGQTTQAGLVKYDLSSRRVTGFFRFQMDGKPALAVGEASFASNETKRAEDDGYIVVFVRDAENHTCMQVYDAVTMAAEPLASVYVPKGFHIPNGFHSEFLSQKVLNSMEAVF